MTPSDSQGELADESGSDERLSDAINQARVLMERWHNRLTLGNLAFAERYIKGQLRLHLHFRKHGFGSEDFCAIFDDVETVIRCEGVPHAFVHRRDEREAAKYAAHERQHFMLIAGVEGNEIQQWVVPALVRFDDLQQVHGALSRSLLYSCRSGFQFVDVLEDREVQLARGPMAGGMHSLSPQYVEGSPQVVDGVGSASSPERGYWSALHTPDEFVGLRIILQRESIAVSFEKGFGLGVEFTDVLFGPFDLDPSAGRPVTHEDLLPSGGVP